MHEIILVVGDDYEKELEPFALDTFDWYQLGGRWFNVLKLKDGAVGVGGEPSLLAKDKTPKKGHCDQAKAKDLDFTIFKDKFTPRILHKGEWFGFGDSQEFMQKVESIRDDETVSAVDIHI